MTTTTKKKRGRPRKWVLNEEITQIRELIFDLKKRNPHASLTEMWDLVKTELEETKQQELLKRLKEIWDLVKMLTTVPPRCSYCGGRTYRYIFRKVDTKTKKGWEVLARCTKCLFLRRWLGRRWSRPWPASRDLEKVPTFYQMNGQLTEKPR